jgi:Domain of unknown function (DUF4136)
MTKTLRTVVIATMLASLPAAGFAQKVSYDFDRTATFTRFKTFAIKEGPTTGDPLVDARITAAIESELVARGLTRTDANPDLVVTAHMILDKQKRYYAYNTGYGPYGWGPGYGWGWGPYGWGYGGWGTTEIREKDILMGTLRIDMADANDTMVWRGTGVKRVKQFASAQSRDQRVRRSVAKILRTYPPMMGR